MILNEAFRNAYDCGSESFKRAHIKIREIDLPFIVKVNENANVGRARSSKELAQSGPHVELKSRKKLGFQTVETKHTVVEDWKNNKEKDITSHIADLESELYAVEAQLEEMKRPIMEQPLSCLWTSIRGKKNHAILIYVVARRTNIRNISKKYVRLRIAVNNLSKKLKF